MSDNKTKVILVIASDPATAGSISAALNHAGYRTIIAESPEKAVAIPGLKEGVNLVITDAGYSSDPALAGSFINGTPVIYITDDSSEPVTAAVDVPHYGIIGRNSGPGIVISAVEVALRLYESDTVFRSSIRDYHEIFDSSSDALFVHDGETGALVEVNMTMLKLYGYDSKDEVLKLAVGDLSAAEEGYDGEMASRLMKDAIESEHKLFEWKAKRKNGEVFWVEVMLHGATIGGRSRIIATVRDISKRKMIEEELKRTEDVLKQEKRFTHLILDTSPAFIVAIDLKGKILMMNRALLDFTGYSLDELVGKDYLAYMVPREDREQLSGIFRELVDGRMSTVNENRIMSRSGSIRLVEWRGRFVSAADAGNSFFVGVGIDITERKRVEEEMLAKNEELTAMNEEMEAANEELIAVNHELQVAEERYRGVVDTQSEMIARFLDNGTITFVNLAWRNYYGKYLGFSGEIVGRTIQDLMQINNFDQVMSFLRKLNPGEISSSMERNFVSLSGENRWQLWYIQKIVDESRNLIEYQVVGNDITERKAAETALRESEERFRSLIELAPDAILVGDVNGVIIGANRRASELTGYTYDELKGRSINIFFTEEERKRVPLRYDLLKAGLPVRSERIMTQKDGNAIFIEMNTRMMPDGTYQTFVRDMTERKNAEKSISDEKERRSVTLRSIADGVITTDTGGRIMIMNRVAEELTGWVQHEAEGRELESVFTILNESDRQPCESPVRNVIWTGTLYEQSGNTLLLSRDGTERIITHSSAPIRDMNSVIIGMVLVFRDVTEKRRLIEAVQQTDKLNSLGVLAGGIAHDFNNLLSGIFGYIEMARLKSVNDKAVTGYLDKAFTVFNRARDLTQQLLTFSKGGAPVMKTGDISMLVREIALFALSGSNIICDFDFAQGLKLCDFDENQLGQVVDNIVINAKQAMPLGGRIKISVANCRLEHQQVPVLGAGDYIRISISDTGIGIPPEMIKRIYDPFFTTKQQGNGLGLATAYSIMRNHEGYIEAESVPGSGTTFYIYLPVSHRSMEAYPLNQQAEHRGSGRILVMDDEEFIREIASEILSDMGYSVACATDGRDAIRQCTQMRDRGELFNAAFFDLTVPGGMGGKETVAEIRSICPDMPVFASSGFSEDHIMSHPAEYGFTASIRKPYRRDELASLLNRYMDK